MSSSPQEPSSGAKGEPFPLNSSAEESPFAFLKDLPSDVEWVELPVGPLKGEEKASSRTGWLIGIILGVVGVLWAFSPVRYTLSAQTLFALAENSLPWIRAVDTHQSGQEREFVRLNATAAAAPQDYLLQIGRATVLANTPAMRDSSSLPPTSEDTNDRSLVRLGGVARDFPGAAGAYAHLIRYMVAERVRILRAELETLHSPPDSSKESAQNNPVPRSIPARHRDVKLMEWALDSGERLDPDNAYWPAMRAVVYFAAMRDQDALTALEGLKKKSHWDAHIYEEVLGQWRLYSATYGDNGAAQKIAPLSLMTFPHVRELRRMAEMARLAAERAVVEGRDNDAVNIRRNIARLGLLMRDTSQWSYEALLGTDILFMSTTESSSRLRQNAIRSAPEWEQEATEYIALLKRVHRAGELSWLRREIQASCDLRQRVDVARYDASYPGIPPGIPLVPLFGSWMVGVCLIQQVVALSIAACIAVLWHRRALRRQPLPENVQRLLVTALCIVFGYSGALMLSGLPSPRATLVFLASAVILFVLALEWIYRYLQAKRSQRREEPEDQPEARWTRGTTLRMLVVLLVPALTALWLLRQSVSGLHPVAALLTNLMGTPRLPTLKDAFALALLMGALPLAVMLLSSIRALYRGVSPLTGTLVGLRRIALPAIACLMIAYLLLLNCTLRLDAAASQAINMAAQNDLQWVLTHSGNASDDS